jgi:hypothetical protein
VTVLGSFVELCGEDCSELEKKGTAVSASVFLTKSRGHGGD